MNLFKKTRNVVLNLDLGKLCGENYNSFMRTHNSYDKSEFVEHQIRVAFDEFEHEKIAKLVSIEKHWVSDDEDDANIIFVVKYREMRIKGVYIKFCKDYTNCGDEKQYSLIATCLAAPTFKFNFVNNRHREDEIARLPDVYPNLGEYARKHYIEFGFFGKSIYFK